MKKIIYNLGVVIICIMFQACFSKMDIAVEEQMNNISTIERESINNSIEFAIEEKNNDSTITKEIALKAVNNYCHEMYDFSITEENPDIMYIEMGEETEDNYQVIFHSYTGAIVYFDVDKQDGSTKITEYVPALDIREETGTISIFDYIN